MAFPTIQTAIPVARYQYGEFGVSVLDEVESPDPQRYRFLMAFVREGESRPGAFVCCEFAPPGEGAQGRYRLRVVTGSMDEVVATDDRFGSLDAFCEQGLALGAQLLGLQDEQPFRLA
jgi:hypothetical protein